MSSKKIRNRKSDSGELRALNGESEITPELLMGEGLEIITEELIEQLVRDGSCDEQTLRECKAMGMRYCRSRNSFFSPPQFFGDISGMD
jgi:hypothetical protein